MAHEIALLLPAEAQAAARPNMFAVFMIALQMTAEISAAAIVGRGACVQV
jgi:hypothetical protein